jgi:hypothetical protein
MNEPQKHLKGSCHCGAVSVRVPEDSIGVVACHCGDCQELHGNFFAMLVANKAEVVWEGIESIEAYRSSDTVQRTFCMKCGSRLAKVPDTSPKVMISAGLFDRTLPRRIIKNVWVESKPDWYDLPATNPLPPEKSES